MAYQQEAIRRGGATPEAAACRRNPSVDPQGRADPRRRAAWLVLRLRSALALSEATGRVEGLVARVLVFEYATLLAPCPACGSARRGRGKFRDGL